MAQAKEQKLAIIGKLVPGDIIGVRGEYVLGKAIRFFTKSNINHSAMYIGNNLLIEASYQICVMSANEYINDDKTEIYCCEVKDATLQDKLDVVNYAVSGYATGIFYGVTGIFGLAFRLWIQHQLWRIAGWFSWEGRNKLAPEHNYWCSEAVGVWWAIKGKKFTNEDVTWLTPDQIYNSEIVNKIN